MDNLLFDMQEEVTDEELLELFLTNTQEIVDFNIESEPQPGTSKQQKEETKNNEEDIQGTILINESAKSFFDFLIQYAELIRDRAEFKKGFFNNDINESLITSSCISNNKLSIIKRCLLFKD